MKILYLIFVFAVGLFHNGINFASVAGEVISFNPDTLNFLKYSSREPTNRNTLNLDDKEFHFSVSDAKGTLLKDISIPYNQIVYYSRKVGSPTIRVSINIDFILKNLKNKSVIYQLVNDIKFGTELYFDVFFGFRELSESQRLLLVLDSHFPKSFVDDVDEEAIAKWGDDFGTDKFGTDRDYSYFTDDNYSDDYGNEDWDYEGMTSAELIDDMKRLQEKLEDIGHREDEIHRRTNYNYDLNNTDDKILVDLLKGDLEEERRLDDEGAKIKEWLSKEADAAYFMGVAGGLIDEIIGDRNITNSTAIKPSHITNSTIEPSYITNSTTIKPPHIINSTRKLRNEVIN